MQRRLPKFSRSPQALGNRQLTERSLAIISAVHRHRILPTSLLVHLIPGNHRVTQAHLQTLYHRGLINRFTFFRAGRPGEFHYYLDNIQALKLLAEQGSAPEGLDFEGVQRNKEKNYAAIHDPASAEEMQGRLLFLKHEVMISRFHAMLELAARRSGGAVTLAAWQQGPQLWSSVELEEGERLPHRPDAFFTLRYTSGAGECEQSFFYEADRKTTSTTKHNRKLRAHFQFIVKQKLHELRYGIKRIRAVLIETLDDAWAETLRRAAGEQVVSGSKPSRLFWFTTSRLFTAAVESEAEKRTAPAYLSYPEIIFKRIWASPVDDTLYSLLD